MKTREDVVQALNELHADLRANPEGWENPTLDRFLEAMSAWLDSAKLRQVNEPSWELICDLLKAGKIYE
jgi:hypothetical protein